jgi:guanyl-specific ribonuclease Sa
MLDGRDHHPGRSTMRMPRLLIAAALLVAAVVWWRLPAPEPAATSAPASMPAAPALPAFLPAEARATLALIARHGPFPHRQDGSVFENRERHLPQQPRGYYHEYTVQTPGLATRGARRLITGGNPPVVYYYTDDHYRSFRSFGIRVR